MSKIKLKSPDISFVIPVYNGEDFLAEAISSCLMQSHKNVEVIVVDDASTDSTRRIIEHYAKEDKRVRPTFLEKNQGRGHARNVGNKAAKSRYLAVLDADDLSDKFRAERCLKIFKQTPGAVIHGCAAIVDTCSQEVGGLVMEKFDLDRSVKEGVNRLVHSTMAYPRSIALKYPYDEGEYAKIGLDDWLFQLRLGIAKCK